MNNFVISLKRFFKNKNTVTVLGVVVILGLLYFAYNYTVNNAVQPVQIPVAAKTIQPRTEITRDMISTISVPSIAASKGSVIRSIAQITGKYTNVNSVIPEGSMFYKQMIVEKSELPDSAFTEVKDGEIPVQFRVSMESTYGNSIYPGNKVDIYMKANNELHQVMIGKLFENIEVLAVKDSSGRHVFENSEEARTPAFILFGLKPEYFILLTKAQYMTNFGVELILIPHGGIIASEGETEVSTQYLVDFIDANTVTIFEDQKSEVTGDNTTDDDEE